jgi:undecaprenyl-diphosphatase
MSVTNVIILAIVQGLAELLPVSSSAHVVIAEKLLSLDVSSPPMTLLLVMLHTGTMFAALVYFWRQWRDTYFQSVSAFKNIAGLVVSATALSAVMGEAIILVVERRRSALNLTSADDLTLKQATLIGAIQGLCLPFRGFSRSGATISTGMLLGVAKPQAEAFSFALAVVLTPPVVARETMRLVKAVHGNGAADLAEVALLSLLGAAAAFLAGLFPLKWLSRWLEGGRWHLFGIYCLIAGVAVTILHRAGY